MALDDLTPYLDALASAAPVPGGGAAAAVTIAQGLALLSMVCNLTLGKKKFAPVEAEVHSLLSRLTTLRAESMSLARDDMAAFASVMDAYRLPADSPPQAAIKKEALARATCAAAEPPCRLMQIAADALPLADRLEVIGNPNVRSDVLVGRHLLIAGRHASRENVEINLNSLPPEHPFVAAMRARMATIDPTAERTLV